MKKKNGSGIAQSDFEKAEEFNGQFTDVFTKMVHNQVPLLDRFAPFMDEIVVTKEGVTKLLKGLDPSKALGPDELQRTVLKELAKELGHVLHISSSSQSIRVKSPRNGHLLIFAHFSGKVTGPLLVITAQFL